MHVLLVLGAAILALVLSVGMWRIKNFMRSGEPPPVATSATPIYVDQRDPVAACKEIRSHLVRPPAISLWQEAAVYQALITQHLLPTFDHRMEPIGQRRIVIHPLTAELPSHHGQSVRWALNSTCTGMPALAKATAKSFRFANRTERQPLPRLFSLPVPVIFATPPQGVTEGQRFFKGLRDSAGFVRLSRVGFAPDTHQALVYIEHAQNYGFGSGTFFLMVRDGGSWRIHDIHLAWIA